jgi:energy-coupling factor transporter ATP-binding protein EcfA2
MRITELHLKNFRGVRCATLKCGALTALVGRNGAGKSTFLNALDLLYRPTATVSLEDFTHRRTDAPLEIRVTYENLTPEESSEFSLYIQNGRLIVTKRFTPPAPGGTSTGQYIALRQRYAPFAPLRSLGKADKRAQTAALAKELVVQGLISEAPTIKSEPDAEAFMQRFEEANPSLLTLVEDPYQFFGVKTVGGGKLDSFTRFVYVPAVRDAQQETTMKGTSFSQLLELAVLRKVNSMPSVSGLQAKVQQLVTEAYEPEDVRGSVIALQNDINAVLQDLVPSAALSLKWSGDPGVSIEAPRVLPSLSEDDFDGEIAKKGHGLQRALIFALLSQLARLKTPSNEGRAVGASESEPSTPTESTSGHREPNYIIGIEEPELYQHPNRCRHFAKVLRRLADGDGSDDSTTQILFTTHSPYFVSLEKFSDVRIVRKDATDPAGLSCTGLTSRTVEDFRGDWVALCERDSRDVTETSLLLRLQRTMTQFVNEGFFADIAVLVEGLGDVGVLSAVAAARRADWLGKGVTVLAVDGKENLAAPVLIFRALKIPTYYVFDGDKQCQGGGKAKNEEQTKAANRRLLLLAGVNLSPEFSGFPDEMVTGGFACFSRRLEDRCSEDIGDPLFAKVCAKVAHETGTREKDTLKSAGTAQRFVETVYAEGRSLPGIERIVDAITDFAVAVNAHSAPPRSPAPSAPLS